MRSWPVVVTAVLVLVGSCAAQLSNATRRCKRDVNTIFPSGFCGSFTDCYDCTETGVCGWCGGAGCGITAQGCYNLSARVDSPGRARHEGEKLCGAAEGDEWLDQPRKCSYCSRFAECDRCLNAATPHWHRPGAQCLWCEESRKCRRGDASSGAFYEDDVRACVHYRFQRGPAQCASFVRCEQQTSCVSCRGSFADAQTKCEWCVDDSVPWTSVDEGGGRCRAHNATGGVDVAAVKCAALIGQGSRLACPMRPNNPGRDSAAEWSTVASRYTTLICGIAALLLLAMLAAAVRLTQ